MEFSPEGAISSHAWLAIVIYILRFCEDITEKNDSIIIFNNLKRFVQKK